MDPAYRDMLADVAGMYYLQEKTQNDIAEALGLSRVKVYRLLKEAREAGVVEITVHRSHARNDRLERTLCERFGLADALVLDTAGLEQADVGRGIGEIGARAVERQIRDGATIAVYLGRSTYAVAQAIRPGLHHDVRVAQAVGSTLFATRGVDSATVARQLAAALGGEARYLPSPMFADSVEATAVLRRQPAVEQTLAIARQADLALLGIGNLDPAASALAIASGLSADQLAGMRAAGVVGDMGGRVFTADGGLPEHELTGRVVGLTFEELRRIPTVIAVAFGAAKACAILGALRTGVVDVLCTDDVAAREVLRA
jgi:DNA-binding transcriptional regulator LsrR (DeoR family)